MSNGIFISYRRSDTEGEASRLAEDLRERLDDVQIFRDVETIAPGEDFVEALERALGDCAVMLVMIGPTWVDARGDNGERRLEDPKDWVRLEVGRALARKVRAIPITCRGASEPKAAALPSDLQPLCTKQAVEIDNNRWRYDVDRLIDRLVQIEGLRRRARPDAATNVSPHVVVAPPASPLPPPVKSSGVGKGLLIGGALALVAVIALVLMRDDSDSSRSASPPPGSDPYALQQPAEAEPRAAPKAQPAPGPAPQALPVPPPVQVQPNATLSGIWRSRDGEVYNFEQRGNEIAATLQLAGGIVGVGRGELNGTILQLVIAVPSGNTQVQANCALQAAPDWRSFNGMCAGPGGQYGVSIFR